MGWYNFIIGMQHKGWAAIQDRHYHNIYNCKKSGNNWASKLQFELWSFVWDLWKHRQDIRLETPSVTEAKAAASIKLNHGGNTLPPLYTT